MVSHFIQLSQHFNSLILLHFLSFHLILLKSIYLPLWTHWDALGEDSVQSIDKFFIKRLLLLVVGSITNFMVPSTLFISWSWVCFFIWFQNHHSLSISTLEDLSLLTWSFYLGHLVTFYFIFSWENSYGSVLISHLKTILKPISNLCISSCGKDNLLITIYYYFENALFLFFKASTILVLPGLVRLIILLRNLITRSWCSIIVV